MKTDTWLYVLIGGFASGIFTRSFFDFSLTVSALVGLLGAGLLGLFFLSRERAKGAHTLLFVSIFLAAASLGMLRVEVKEFRTDASFPDSLVGQKIIGQGIVVDEPSLRGASQRLAVSFDEVNGKPVSLKILVTADSCPNVSYGDKIGVKGKLERPQAFETDTGRMFEYPAYLAKDDIYYQIRFASVSVVSEGSGNPVTAGLFALKRAFLSQLGEIVPEPESSLAGGLLVGGKQSLGADLEQEFRRAGIIHIVVLSGYNITIVADAAMRLFSFLPRALGMGAGVFAIILFAVMTGASATIVRASIMALLVVLARATGRTYQITRALLIAGFLMLLQNPHILAFDPSFQLSFLSTIGLIYVAPLIEKRLGWMPTQFGLREAAVATFATQLAVLPLLLYQTGQLSLVALPVNLLVLPLIPLSMFLGFLTGMVGFISTLLALPFGFLLYLPLAYELAVVHFFSQLPFAAVSVPQISGIVLLASYAIFAGFLIWFSRRSERGVLKKF